MSATTVPCKDIAGKKLAEGDTILVLAPVPAKITAILPGENGNPPTLNVKPLANVFGAKEEFPVMPGHVQKWAGAK
jgi:hypothetical protein